MSAETFVDTALLVYAYDARDVSMQQIAVARLTREGGSGAPTISTSILGELYWTLLRKQIVLPADAARAVRDAAAMRVVSLSRTTILTALDLADRHRMQWWDAVHLATAVEHGCKRILTEDVPGTANRGRGQAPELEGVVYENPFGPG